MTDKATIKVAAALPQKGPLLVFMEERNVDTNFDLTKMRQQIEADFEESTVP